MISESCVKKLGEMCTVSSSDHIQVNSFSGRIETLTSRTVLSIEFNTLRGALWLTNVSCWILPGGLPNGMRHLLLSRGVMERLGYSRSQLTEKENETSPVFNLIEESSESERCAPVSRNQEVWSSMVHDDQTMSTAREERKTMEAE